MIHPLQRSTVASLRRRTWSAKFLQNDTFQLWGLHAWVWKENPSGMFANWNPNVTCANTTAVANMVH